jgi:uncharacterized protein YecE (DUF72 family)
MQSHGISSSLQDNLPRTAVHASPPVTHQDSFSTMRILTGMSGYSYKEWRGGFYPADLPAGGMLGYYASRFPTVEINNTFYRMPKETVLLDWATQVPDGFTFSLKASRRITHDHRLGDVGTLLDYLLRNASVLGPSRGPTLFQLPPNMKKDVPRLAAFLELLPRGWQTAIEWRHASWFDEEVYALLRARDIALVVAESEDGSTPVEATAAWGYLRLHRSGYTDAGLQDWLDRIRAMPWGQAFVYFKHEEEIAGPPIGLRFQELAGLS